MTTSTVARPVTSYRPAVSKHALAMLPPAHSPAPPLPSPPIPMPIQVAPSEIVPEVKIVSQWAPIPCHTVLPTKRFRFR